MKTAHMVTVLKTIDAVSDLMDGKTTYRCRRVECTYSERLYSRDPGERQAAAERARDHSQH